MQQQQEEEQQQKKTNQHLNTQALIQHIQNSEAMINN